MVYDTYNYSINGVYKPTNIRETELGTWMIVPVISPSLQMAGMGISLAKGFQKWGTPKSSVSKTDFPLSTIHPLVKL